MNNSAEARLPPGPILGIETSCDETAAAVLTPDGRVLSNIISSQQIVHERFGGVVPELAARAHIQNVEAVVKAALSEAGVTHEHLGAIVVTQGPGLAGALLVGLSYAKALAYALEIPLVGVSHLAGHIASAWIDRSDFSQDCVVLVASGGHAPIPYSGSRGLPVTRANDRRCGGGGIRQGSPDVGARLPRRTVDRQGRSKRGPCCSALSPIQGKIHGPGFQFQRLENGLALPSTKMSPEEIARQQADLAAGYQEAIVDVLVRQSFEAVRRSGARALAVVGGVSANSRLRSKLTERASDEGIDLGLPKMAYCTDNAAMIAAAGRMALLQGKTTGLDCEVIPDFALPTR
ncbi:MAG: tRNA (adenosine(37)-N6)-threonylcarbamoyltransferase complex transferase subunit TsaD [Nitrospiraceae bacterium]